MPVLSDKSTLNAQLVKWCQDHYPDYLNVVTSKKWWGLIDMLQSIGDVYMAAKFFVWIIQSDKGVRKHVEGNEALINAIRKDALRIDR